MDHFRPGTAGNISSIVELSVLCKNLANKDVFSKSDPCCVLFIKEFGKKDWIEFDRTEIISNNLNPEWSKKFVINYFFEEHQQLKFEMYKNFQQYDIDSASNELKRHDLLGRIECTLGEIISRGKLELLLKDGPKQNSGTVIITAEEVEECKETLTFRFEAKNLYKHGFFVNLNPFLAFYRVNEDGTFTVVHRTEYVKKSLNPIWKQFTVSSRKFCGGDRHRSILVKCFSWNNSDEEDLIGEFSTNVHEMVKASGRHLSFELINMTLKAKKKKYANSGRITLMATFVTKIHSFIDFISSGTQLSCTIAIDFTASNGLPTESHSLHNIHPDVPNPYIRALSAVGRIIEDYDSDKLFPVLGFGAKVPPNFRVLQDFFVNGLDHPYCHGISGVIAAYQNCLANVVLSGPTNFASCINHVAKLASSVRAGSEYFILLIITDGIISDMVQTKRAIISASSFPLSIIIVGVGNANFSSMRELDSDKDRLSVNGRFAERDIVQFVPFRQFVKTDEVQNAPNAQALLAREVLAEIPGQFLSYMAKMKITPGSWIQQSSARPSTAYSIRRIPTAPHQSPF